MKIGIVTQSYYPRPGGVTEVVHFTAHGLRLLGHEVHVITTHFGGFEASDPNVVRIGRNALVPMNGAWVNITIGFDLAGQLRRILDREAFDIVHTHCPLVPTLPLMTISAVRPGQKLVGTFHAAAESNFAYRVFRGPLGRRVLRLDRRMAVSEAARRFANSYFPGMYDIVPNGVDCARFRSDVAPIDRYRDGRLNILFVGRLDRRKGAPHLLRALPIVARELGGRVRLLIVGESGVRKMLCARPARLAGAEIVWVGRVAPEELPRYYVTADVFCSPAVGQESFGIVLLEALASGTAVVASDIPGYRAVIEDGVDGLLVPPRDPAAIARAIVGLAADRALRARLGENGKAKALQHDWSIIVRRLEAIYRVVLGGVSVPASRPELRSRASS